MVQLLLAHSGSWLSSHLALRYIPFYCILYIYVNSRPHEESHILNLCPEKTDGPGAVAKHHGWPPVEKGKLFSAVPYKTFTGFEVD